MSTGRDWRDTKAEAHRRHPELADPERQAKARADLDAHVAGHHLEELRKAAGKTQAVPKSSVCASHLDITVSVGPHSVMVA